MVMVSVIVMVAVSALTESVLSLHPWRERDATHARPMAASARMNCMATGCEGKKVRGRTVFDLSVCLGQPFNKQSEKNAKGCKSSECHLMSSDVNCLRILQFDKVHETACFYEWSRYHAVHLKFNVFLFPFRCLVCIIYVTSVTWVQEWPFRFNSHWHLRETKIFGNPEKRSQYKWMNIRQSKSMEVILLLTHITYLSTVLAR